MGKRFPAPLSLFLSHTIGIITHWKESSTNNGSSSMMCPISDKQVWSVLRVGWKPKELNFAELERFCDVFISIREEIAETEKENVDISSNNVIKESFDNSRDQDHGVGDLEM
ncbi:hypothetical protein SSX86_004045 [Deinandra increscens subsp. villosa]|uniref:Uncharacterized protein n=1 Tax=Deinandra increscens subsp. villosa TaxID=3103831 RepID=A0AAP0DIH6_9ASTR